ncbi:hypothetical protein [Streptosporangium lutulentum]|uniref:Flagellar biosynthesis regulator FlaF n=1 Tax=Streptosporangium lutulentum TaxID=1461250 RepID=A0ABT9Q918_9ACTN|nr:hypothetical protein [Streptosporangium lutulentum]MDP9843242.1 flagellar biosynthesis regulator FlaF [Streptosporangium lutulentum]
MTDVSVDLQKTVAALRQRYSAQVDALTYENAVLATAVEQLQERVNQLEQQFTGAVSGGFGA